MKHDRIKHFIRALFYTNIVLSIIAALMILLLSIVTNAKNNKIDVMIIDTGVSDVYAKKGMPLYNYYDKKYIDSVHSKDQLPKASEYYGHGTHIAGIALKGVCKEVNMIPCNVFEFKNEINGNVPFMGTNRCLYEAVRQKVDVVNYSISGSTYNKTEELLIKELNNNKIKFVTAVGNDSINIDVTPHYPALFHKKYKNVIAVGAVDPNNKILDSSNYGDGVIFEQGVIQSLSIPTAHQIKNNIISKTFRTGTSMAAAMHTNKILKNKCKQLKQGEK